MCYVGGLLTVPNKAQSRGKKRKPRQVGVGIAPTRSAIPRFMVLFRREATWGFWVMVTLSAVCITSTV